MRIAQHRRSQMNRRAKEILVKISKLARLGLRWSALAFGVLALTVLATPSAKTNQPAGLIPQDVMKLMAVYGAEAVTLDRNSRDYKQSDQIEWKGRPGSGNQSAILFGDPAKRVENGGDVDHFVDGFVQRPLPGHHPVAAVLRGHPVAIRGN